MFQKGATMKNFTIVIIAMLLVFASFAAAKGIDTAVRPNFGYRHIDGGADQLVLGGSFDVIFNQMFNGYMGVRPGFEVGFLDNVTTFNVNIPIVGRYPTGSITPYAHLGLAIAYIKSGDYSETDVEFLLGGGADFRIGPNMTVGQ